MKRSLLFASLVLLGVLCGRPLIADLIFQMRSTPSEPQWREAGGLFLEGVGRVFDWLSMVERRGPDIELRFAEAIDRLTRAKDNYAKLAESATSDREVSPTEISAPTRERMLQTFRGYRVELPTREKDAARLAASEVEAMIAKVTELRPAVEGGNVAALQELLTALNRVQRIGTYVALFFEEAEKPR